MEAAVLEERMECRAGLGTPGKFAGAGGISGGWLGPGQQFGKQIASPRRQRHFLDHGEIVREQRFLNASVVIR